MPIRSLLLASSLEINLDLALTELKTQLDKASSPGKFAVVFCTPDYPASELASSLQQLLAGIPWIGMSVPALLTGTELHEHGIGLALFCQADLQAAVSGPLTGHLSDWATGQSALRQVMEQLPEQSQQTDLTLLVLCDPAAGNISETLLGAIQEAGSGPAWIGGGSGQPGQPGFLMANGQILNQALVVAALTQPCVTALAQGWTALGATALVTRSSRDLIYELNYQPALTAYAQLAERDGFRLDPERFSEFASGHPLAIPLVSGHYLIRTLTGYNAHEALCSSVDIPENCLVQLMSGHPSTLMAASAAAAKSLGSPLAGALAFIGHGRRPVLGPRSVDEYALLGRSLGKTPLLGCISFGEICRFSGGVPHYHNQAIALLGVPL